MFSVVLIAGLWNSRHLPFVPDIGTVLAKPDLQAETLSMGHMLDLTGESFAALRLPAAFGRARPADRTGSAFWLRRRGASSPPPGPPPQPWRSSCSRRTSLSCALIRSSDREAWRSRSLPN
jgi:hypothetical protein